MKRNLSFQLPALKKKVKGNVFNKSLIQTNSQFRIKKVVKKEFSKTEVKRVEGVVKKTVGMMGFMPLRVIKEQYVIKNSSESESESEEEINRVVLLVATGMIIDTLGCLIREVILESFAEITSAALTLHSNSILDHLLKELIGTLVYQIVNSSINELKNSELFDICLMIEDKICNEQLKDISQECVNKMLAKHFFFDFFEKLNLESICTEALSGEIVDNNKVLKMVVEGIIEAILSEDWLEILVEDQVSYSKICENYNLLSQKAQKEISNRYLFSKFDGISEEIFFDMVNLFVGSIWTRNIVEHTLKGEDPGELVLMPTNPQIRNKKLSILQASIILLNLHR